MVSMLFYVLIVLMATTIGAITGLGGGVIIKPLFDMIGLDGPSTIGFYSSVSVFTMCLVSIYKQIRKGFSFQWPILVSISLGSVLGGILGDRVFGLAVQAFSSRQVSLLQASLLLGTLVLILLYTLYKGRIRSFRLANPLMVFAVGLFLGTISVFLGIGGGPLNIALLMWLFSMSMKESAVYSIATIFFSQLSNLTSSFISRDYLNYPLAVLPFLMVAAIAGGYMGTLMNQRLDNNKVEQLYLGLMIVLMFVSVFNIWQNL